jgi:hypothetical protein
MLPIQLTPSSFHTPPSPTQPLASRGRRHLTDGSPVHVMDPIAPSPQAKMRNSASTVRSPRYPQGGLHHHSIVPLLLPHRARWDGAQKPLIHCLGLYFLHLSHPLHRSVAIPIPIYHQSCCSVKINFHLCCFVKHNQTSL